MDGKCVDGSDSGAYDGTNVQVRNDIVKAPTPCMCYPAMGLQCRSTEPTSMFLRSSEARRVMCNCANSGYIIQLMAPFIMGWIKQNVWMLVLVLLHVKELQLKIFHFGR